MNRTVTRVTLKFDLSSNLRENEVKNVIDEITNFLGEGVSCISHESEQVEIKTDPDQIYHGIYLDLDPKNCPNCGADLTDMSSLVIDTPGNRRFGEAIGTLLPNGSVQEQNTTFIEDDDGVEDVCCRVCNESLLHVQHRFKFTEGSKDATIDALVKR